MSLYFLYLPYNAPHTPLQVTSKYYERFPEIKDERQRIYAAMVSAMDDGIGRVLETLRSNGLWEKTLVVFLSDNGCATYTQACFNDPLLGGKLTVFEGGHRVPFLMQWPGTLPPGRKFEHAVSTLDIYPTAVRLVGQKAPKLIDGVDLMPYLTAAKSVSPHETLFWRNGDNLAVRHQQWKLVKLDGGRYTRLYDLSVDVGERRDLAPQRPEMVKKLAGLIEAWSSELVEPLWPSKSIVPFEQDGMKFNFYV